MRNRPGKALSLWMGAVFCLAGAAASSEATKFGTTKSILTIKRPPRRLVRKPIRGRTTRTVAVPRGGGNLARGRPATQSSIGWGGHASRAVDGNTDGRWPKGSVTHTGNQAQPWWQVDLGSSKSIALIRLWNRTDCCWARLQNVFVLVSQKPFVGGRLADVRRQPGVWAYRIAGRVPKSKTIAVNRPGRYVRVQLAGRNFLSLAEVEVIGAAAPKPRPAARRSSLLGRLGLGRSVAVLKVIKPAPKNKPALSRPPGRRSVAVLKSGPSSKLGAGRAPAVGPRGRGAAAVAKRRARPTPRLDAGRLARIRTTVAQVFRGLLQRFKGQVRKLLAAAANRYLERLAPELGLSFEEIRRVVDLGAAKTDLPGIKRTLTQQIRRFLTASLGGLVKAAAHQGLEQVPAALGAAVAKVAPSAGAGWPASILAKMVVRELAQLERAANREAERVGRQLLSRWGPGRFDALAKRSAPVRDALARAVLAAGTYLGTIERILDAGQQSIVGVVAPQGVAATGAVATTQAGPKPARDTLRVGQRLPEGGSLWSANRRFYLAMQSDGNLVVYDKARRKALWAAYTQKKRGQKPFAIVQGDGNFVVYGVTKIWATRTGGRGGNRLVMQSDGNLVFYAGSRAVWASNTAQRALPPHPIPALPRTAAAAAAMVFDPAFYLSTYPDLRRAFGNNHAAARLHWQRSGIREGRRSAPGFSIRGYLARYPDLRKAFGATNFPAALQHWLQQGWRERRNPGPLPGK